jgi:serine/threonine-protein kinase RsbW
MARENREGQREHFEEVLESVQEVAEHVEEVVGEKLEAVGLGEDDIHKFKLAVREAALNAVKHGNKEDTSKKVTFLFDYDPATNEVVVSFTDEGEGFDPDEVPDPTKDENILKTGGRGILTMRAGANVQFERGGRKAVLRKTFGQKEG